TVLGSPTAELRHARDERYRGCCQQPNVGDLDPAMHPCATVPDLVAWIGPRHGAAFCQRSAELEDLAPRLPSRRADQELATRPGAGARRFEEPTWGTHDFLRRRPTACSRLVQAKDGSALTLYSCLVQPAGCNPVAKKAVQTRWRKSAGSESNDRSEEKIFKIPGCALLTLEAI